MSTLHQPLIKKPIVDLGDARRLFVHLVATGNLWHPEDDATECLTEEAAIHADILNTRMTEIYALDFGPSTFDCPCAMALETARAHTNGADVGTITRNGDGDRVVLWGGFNCANIGGGYWHVTNQADELVEAWASADDVREITGHTDRDTHPARG